MLNFAGMSKKVISFLILLSMAGACRQSPEAPAAKEPGPGSEEIKGLTALNEEIKKNPGDAELYYSRADLYLLNGKTREGLADLEEAIALDSSQAYFYLRLADELMRIENKELQLPDSKRAIETLLRYLKRDPENEKVNQKLADLYIYTKQNKAALDLLQSMIDRAPYQPPAYFKRGFIFKSMGDTAAAVRAFRKASEQDPSYFEAYMQLGLLHNRSRPQLALQYYNNALDIRPGSKEALYAKARLLQDLKRYEEAKKIYREMVRIDAQDEQIFYNLGYLYYEQDSLEKAERNFNIAIGLNPAFDFAYYARGVVRESRGNPAGAVSDYQNALRINPEHPYAGEALEELKKKN